jgi:PKD repeat protein
MVTDNDGATDSDTRVITVNQEPIQNETPIANFDASKENLKVTFQDTSTDSDGYLTNWHWDFGDSNYSDLKNPVHTYEDEGSYTVILTVTDNDNMTNSYTLTITVEKKQGENNGGIPGFELASLILLIISLLIIKKRKRNM